MEATLTTPKTRFTDYSENYKELIGKIVGISQYSSMKFANIIEVTKTGFKIDAKGYEKTIFRFDTGYEKGDRYSKASASLYSEEGKARYEADLIDRRKHQANVNALREMEWRFTTPEQLEAIMAILNLKPKQS